MLHHLVWWTLKEEANGTSAADNMATMKKMLEDLQGKIPTLKSLEVSISFAPTCTMPAHILLHTTHDDQAGLKEYADHPLHQACIPFIKDVVASRQAIDYIV